MSLKDLLVEKIKIDFQSNNLKIKNGVITLLVAPSISKSFTLKQNFKDDDNKLIRYQYPFDNIDDEKIYTFFQNKASQSIANKLEFIIENREVVQVNEIWDQSIIDESEESLPKAKRGTIVPWYMEGLVAQPEPKIWHNYTQIPIAGHQFDTTNLTYDKAFAELNKMVTFKNDWQWDGGYYDIKCENQNWSGTAGLFIFETEEEKENFRAIQYEVPFNITEDVKTLFLFIQNEYYKSNPTAAYDHLFVTVQTDAINYSKDFELNGEDVYPDAPPEPAIHDSNYYWQNLYNCLAHNAPPNFEWLMYSINRNFVNNNELEISGQYHYSLNIDKSKPQELMPGEETFMMNVTIRLMDEFLEPDFKNFKELLVHFNNVGNPFYKVVSRHDDQI